VNARDLRERMREHVCTDECHTEPLVEWWCPSDETWTVCPGPCPDGQPHDQTRQRDVLMHALVPPRPSPPPAHTADSP
jgi:hypothetical protein